MSRDSEGGMSNTTQVGSASVSGNAGSNNSSLTIKNQSKNHFWDTLTQNIKDILRETDKIFPEGSSETLTQQSSNKIGVAPKAKKKSNSKKTNDNQDTIEPITSEEEGATVTRRSTFREAASVISNPENGIITVRATAKQHEKIQEFIDQVMSNAQRQVLIEATIVEVKLSDNYQQGIDWSSLRLGNTGFQMSQGPVPSTITPSVGKLVLDYANPSSKFGKIASSISLLETFGNVKVLSSPKLSMMNNQTAMLRVVNNLAYFTVEVTPGVAATATTGATAPTFTTNLLTSPVGFTMSVTPQINDSDSVLLNVRPSITRLIRYINDPNPALANPCGFGVANCNIPGIPSKIPETSTREMESMLKIDNNQIAVLGGLMEDRSDKLTDEIPLMARIPVLGNLFQGRGDTTEKTELVIFLRPVVIKNASVNGDYIDFRDSLPDQNFFKEPTNNLLQNQ
jgi:general secretion pathway protein D